MDKRKNKRSRYTNTWLRKQFDQLNHYFFDDRIPSNIKVKFDSFYGDTANGTWGIKDHLLTVNPEMKRAGEPLILVILLHEMVHADLEYRGYRGYPYEGGHGMRFQAELVRLFNAGAYDGNL